MTGAPDAFCSGCGRPAGVCSGCRRSLDPPRFCPHCGTRLTVLVTPAGVRVRCKAHGPLDIG